MPFQNNILAGASGATGYEIPYSLRFRRANSAYLSRTPASTGNQQVMTFSWWMKIGELPSTNQVKVIFASGAAGSNPFFAIGFNDGNNAGGDVPLRMSILEGTSSVLTSLASDMLFRDPSAWYHCVVAIDTTQATSTNRVKLYVNGTQQTLGGTTTYGTSGVYPSLNANINYNTSTYATLIGKSSYLSQYFDGYLAEMNFIDGQALTPSSFGQTDSATGVWVPKKYSGTYGTNGFYLKFADATTTTTIGNDSSGNANNWATSGISVTSGVTFDQMTDTPTLNYCTLSPIYTDGSGAISAANLNFNGLGSNYNISSTIGVSSGKWYWEYTGAAGQLVGVFLQGGLISSTTGALSYFSDGNKYTGSTPSAYGASWTGSDIIGIALDLDGGTLTFYKNNVSQGTAFSSLSGTYFPWVRTSTSATGSLNFGQRAFAYTPPSGFKALNTANLPTPSIKKGSLYMDATLRTGTGATASVSSLNFQPDLVWIKSRSAATNHNLFDSARGVQKGFNSNASGPEYTDANSLTAFNSNGYSLGSDASSRGVNINTNTYVDWAWKKGATPGFDVVAYTGNATNRTIAHNLGAVPKMMIIKNVDVAQSPSSVPVVYHSMLNGGVNPANYYMYLTSTAAGAPYTPFFNNTAPTSSVFTVGTDSFVNGNTRSLVAYLWSEVEGFSKIGSYTGNNSTDGPFVWCGFRPRFILIRTDAVADWVMLDTARDTFNVASNYLRANLASTEGSFALLDVVANGFKVRSTAGGGINSASTNTLFAAFAENPFKYARAR